MTRRSRRSLEQATAPPSIHSSLQIDTQFLWTLCGLLCAGLLLAGTLLWMQGQGLDAAQRENAELLNRLVVAEREYQKVERLARKWEARRRPQD